MSVEELANIDVTAVRSRDGNGWCGLCLLPSLVTERCVISPREDPTVILGSMTYTYCTDHEEGE